MTESASSAAPSERRRFPMLSRELMTDRQRELADEFRGFSLNGINGPFVMMLRSPEAASRFQALGRYLRFDTRLPLQLVELAVLVHARLWNDQYEWMLHAPRAASAGVSEATIAAIRSGSVPNNLMGGEKAVFRYCVELERDRLVCDETFRTVSQHLGEQGVTDLTFMLGQYATISMLLAVAEEAKAVDALPRCHRPFGDYSVQGEAQPVTSTPSFDSK